MPQTSVHIEKYRSHLLWPAFVESKPPAFRKAMERRDWFTDFTEWLEDLGYDVRCIWQH